MGLSRTKKIIIISLLVTVATLAGSNVAIWNKLLHLDTFKNQIITAAQEALKRTVTYERGDFSLFGPSFTFRNVVIKEKDGTLNFITADRLTFKVALFPLLEKKLVLKEIHLDHPVVELSRDAMGAFNIDDLLEEKKEELPLQLKGIGCKKGYIRFTDRMISPTGLTTILEDTDLSVDRFVRGKSCDFKLAATIHDDALKGSISLSGEARLSPKDRPFSDSILNAKLRVKNLDAGHYWPYYSRYVPFQKIVGWFDMESSFKGKFAEFTSKGNVKIRGLRFNYPGIFHAVLTPKDLHFNYDMELSSRDLSVKSLDLTVDGLRVKGSCALRDIHSGDLRITAQATTTPFRLEEFGQYIPYGVIVKDPAEFIEQHIKGGTYRLDEGRLDGKVSQIVHMEKGDNYNVLYIRGRVEKGLVTYGPDVPTFNNIKGELEMRGKDFNLHRMSGNFGVSPFTLEGKITDYPLDKPSGYPFTMTMTPGQAEVAWLFGQGKTGKFHLTGPSTLHLTGSGFTSIYTLSGDWNLTQAAYSYPNIIRKGAGQVNHLSFIGSITKQEAKLSSLQYTLNSLAVAASADYRYAGKSHMVFDVKSNPFPIHETAAMVPLVAKCQPSGIVQTTFRGEFNDKDLKDIRLLGSATLSNVSFRPSENIGTMSAINGTVRFNGDSLETSRLSARLGNSVFYGKGSLNGFKNPAVNLVFSSPSLNMADLGLRAPNQEVKATKVVGNFSLKENDLQIKSLSGQVNNSVINLKGTIQDLRNPKVDISVTSPYLEVEDVILLAELEHAKKRDVPQARMELKASVLAEAGKVKGIDFSKLSTTVMYESKILYLQPLEFAALGGRCSGKARIDFGAEGGPRYQTSFNLEDASSEETEKALNTLGLRLHAGITTGSITLTGEMTAKGKTLPDIKKTLLGTAKIHQKKGTLWKYPVLAKVFSILNVSQLLKFKLPDMVSGGMPYNEINATMSFKDGVMSTDDAVITSEAMKISMVGKVDLVREEIDALIGVQPLQSFDKVVSHIPVVGWILTGEDRSLVTAYFEAKGKWDDPKVSAIPAKSMGKGVLNIFKRIFQLPVKLITDTGEVIIGK